MEQAIAYRRLLSAVIALAVKDACKQSTELRSGIAREALDFLFLYSDGYLVGLDINPEQFRRKVLDYCFSDRQQEGNPFNLDGKERKHFRANYKRWYEITSQTEAVA